MPATEYGVKILVISNLYPPHALGGYEILCGQVCDLLRERGHEVVVLTSGHGVDKANRQESLPAARRELKLYLPLGQPARMMRYQRWRVGRLNYRATSDVIRDEAPDVVFMWSQLRLTVGPARAAEDSGAPVAYTLNDESILGYLAGAFSLNPRRLARYVVENFLIPGITLKGLRMERCTCISALLESNLLARGLPAPDVQVIYQGIPIERFPLKDEPGGFQTPTRLLYAGQLHAYKGVHDLIGAAHAIAEARGKDAARVSIVGSGPPDYEQRLRSAAEAGGAEIDFRGRVPHDEMPSVYREHDILVFPSTWQEPFGLTHLEAMASGTPVVSTANGGQGEFLEHDGNALVFEKGNTEQLARCIGRLMDDAELRRRLAENGRRTVEERFALDRYVADLEEFLEEAARRPQP